MCLLPIPLLPSCPFFLRFNLLYLYVGYLCAAGFVLLVSAFPMLLAKQLLEMGFRPAIEAILRRLPDRQGRQTLLFSATMPADVRRIAQLALKDRYEFVDCVGEEESTHQHVPQQFIVCRLEHQVREAFAECVYALCSVLLVVARYCQNTNVCAHKGVPLCLFLSLSLRPSFSICVFIYIYIILSPYDVLYISKATYLPTYSISLWMSLVYFCTFCALLRVCLFLCHAL